MWAVPYSLSGAPHFALIAPGRVPSCCFRSCGQRCATGPIARPPPRRLIGNSRKRLFGNWVALTVVAGKGSHWENWERLRGRTAS